MLKPMGCEEKTSRKNPPIKAAENPNFLFGFSTIFVKTTKIKIIFVIIPEKLKKTRKLD
jgi:hypothetical protein